MGTFSQYKCENCNKKFELGGPQEFGNTWFGRRMIRHTGIGMRNNISGLWLWLWDNSAHKVVRRVLMEYERKCASFEVWGNRAPVKLAYLGDSSEWLIDDKEQPLLGEIPEGEICPSCKKGKIEFDQQIQT
ncbi:MAG: hypothetical protein GY816_21540 [Cytophagales bacterium]|nr:hypothetical protein [Cytophagales bacterium]